MPAKVSVKAEFNIRSNHKTGTVKAAAPAYLRRSLTVLMMSLWYVVATFAEAGTIVRINTSVGDFSIELYDAVTWRTVENFLAYVEGKAVDVNGDPLGENVNYNQTYLHRTQVSETQGIGIIQGGAFRFTPFLGPHPITDSELVPNIENEAQISNSRGTIAMAKIGGDPNSASYQWFFNTIDNSDPLDTDNGGFTVFGKVLGGDDGTDLEAGMQVLDTIAGLQKFRPCVATLPCPRADFAPIVTEEYQGKPDEELVFVTMEVMDRYSRAVNLFNPASQQLSTSVIIDGGAAYTLKFSVMAVDNQVVLQPKADSVLLLSEVPDGVATFSSGSGILHFPTVELSETDSLCNVDFELSDPELLQFSLVSIPDAC